MPSLSLTLNTAPLLGRLRSLGAIGRQDSPMRGTAGLALTDVEKLGWTQLEQGKHRLALDVLIGRNRPASC